MRIEKKTWPELFQKILDGEKTFDLRIADFNCQSGDELVLQEWDPKTKHYTGRELTKTISFVLKAKDCSFYKSEDIEKYGFVALSFK